MLHHTIKVRRFSFHYGHINRWDLHQSASVHVQVKEGAIATSSWCAIREEDATLIPSWISVTDRSEIDWASAQAMDLVHEIYSAHVRFSRRKNAVVPGEYVFVLQTKRSFNSNGFTINWSIKATWEEEPEVDDEVKMKRRAVQTGFLVFGQLVQSSELFQFVWIRSSHLHRMEVVM